jgi:putative acetyltransferase
MTDRALLCTEADPSASEAVELMAALDDELRQIYPGEPIHGIDSDKFRSGGGVFLIGKLEGVPAACVALRAVDEHTGELKRMFVRPEYRFKGLGRAMLAAIEEVARKRAYRKLRLVTGVSQAAAVALYESAGYNRIPCYGEFMEDPGSRCFEKLL